MAINGASTMVKGLGGKTAALGPQIGDYHIVVNEVAVAESKTSKRPTMQVTLFVKDDPGHAAKEGKKLMTAFISLPMDGDDKEKSELMKAIIRKRWFDGFGIKWPDEGAEFDARKFQGKAAWVRLGTTPAKGQYEARVDVVAIALTADGLGAPKAVKGTEETKATGAARSRR